MKAEKSALPLRIVVDQPIPGVALALQRGSGATFDLVGPVQASADALVFDLDIKVDSSNAVDEPRLLGPFVQGPPTARFVYINVGASAGQIGSPWQRRVKVPLGAITWQAIEAWRRASASPRISPAGAAMAPPPAPPSRSCRRAGRLGDLLRPDDFEIVLADGQTQHRTRSWRRFDLDHPGVGGILDRIMFAGAGR